MKISRIRFFQDLTELVTSLVLKLDMLFLTEYIGPYQDEEEMDRRSPNLRRNDGSYPILGVTEGSCSDDPDSDIQDIPIINQGKASLTPWSYPIAGVLHITLAR